MTEVNEKAKEEMPVESEPKKSTGIPKIVWFIGGGCLLLICITIIASLLIYLGVTFFGGKDPIAGIVPDDSLVFMSVDIAKTQSDNFNDIVTVFQEIADADEDKTLVESMDEFMGDELNMSFTEDIMPWIGQYGALVVTDGDIIEEDAEYLFIIQTRNQGKADEFIEKLVGELESNQDISFDKDEKDGITLYTYKSEYEWEEDTVIARAGKFVYFSNSDNAILDSAQLKKSDSLANATSYKNTIAALPKNRLATVYISGEIYQDDFMATAFEELYGFDFGPMFEEAYSGMDGIGMSVTVEDVGLQFDFAVSYDEEQLSNYQKEALSATYNASNADKLVPENTFFFMGMNSSQDPGSFLEEDNPQYTEDIQEALELFEDEYGINFMELFDLLSGEFSIAIGPSQDGLMAALGEVNMGITLLASTNDETAFNDWFGDVLALASDELDMDFQTDTVTFGNYELQELSVEDYGDTYSAVFYGVDNGYIILGSSRDILENGLDSDATLANNSVYRDTWKAFPSDSVPYMYLDTLALIEFIKDNADSYTVNDLRDIEDGLSKIPTVAIAVNNPSGYSQSMTWIIFFDTE